ncbi:MAG: hypothetical protein JRH11_09450, partial [Deltaproteobacteria bacterium]|nr:hypothetical protein [Deltaproteobacteria bacterium]
TPPGAPGPAAGGCSTAAPGDAALWPALLALAVFAFGRRRQRAGPRRRQLGG